VKRLLRKGPGVSGRSLGSADAVMPTSWRLGQSIERDWEFAHADSREHAGACAICTKDPVGRRGVLHLVDVFIEGLRHRPDKRRSNRGSR
jgi:hypothetical protein